MIQDCWIAFLVGGLLCAIGQVLIDYTKLTPARILLRSGFIPNSSTGLAVEQAFR